MGDGVVPHLRRLGEHAANSITSQALASLDNRAGCNEGPVTGEHNIQPVHDLVEGFFAFERHANDAPDHHFQRETAFTQRDGT